MQSWIATQSTPSPKSPTPAGLTFAIMQEHFTVFHQASTFFSLTVLENAHNIFTMLTRFYLLLCAWFRITTSKLRCDSLRSRGLSSLPLRRKEAMHNLVPIACVPLDQRSENSTALDESKTGTRKSWFRFDCARAPEIVMKRTSFQQPIRFGRLHGELSD